MSIIGSVGGMVGGSVFSSSVNGTTTIFTTGAGEWARLTVVASCYSVGSNGFFGNQDGPNASFQLKLNSNVVATCSADADNSGNSASATLGSSVGATAGQNSQAAGATEILVPPNTTVSSVIGGVGGGFGYNGQVTATVSYVKFN